MKLKLLDLFSGIGGFSLGFEKTGGFETIAFCEKDKFCQSVLAKHWNNIKIYDDIKNLDAREIKADIVTFGIPCQPFSVAGKRKGTSDDRWLWRETLRVVAETKARWCVLENVEGIINISNGTVLQQIQKDLESESFQVQCLIIPASGIGAWHQRKRVWIIAYSNSRLRGRRTTIGESGENEVRRIYSSEEEQARNDIRSKAVGCDAVSKQQTWWQTQSELCGIPDGISYGLDKNRANRIKALGNSIVPEIAYEIAKAILVAENGKVQRHRSNQHGIGK